MDNKPIQDDGLASRAQGLIMAGFVIFVIELIVIICAMLSDAGCKCGTSECFCGAGPMVTIMIAIVPAIISMIMAGRGMAAKRRLRRQGTDYICGGADMVFYG